MDKVAAYRLKIDLHVVKSEPAQAVASGLECLRLFDIDLHANPSQRDVEAAYVAIWAKLGDRPIESLIDLPRATAQETDAAMLTLAALMPPAYLTNTNLYYLVLCQMTNLSLTHGITDSSAQGIGLFGWALCHAFGRYHDGYRFGKLALDLVEERGCGAAPGRVHFAMGLIAVWTKPPSTTIQLFRTAFRKSIESGDLFYATSSASRVIIDLILTGVPLNEVWREFETLLDSVRKSRFRDGIDLIVSQQRFVAAMRGETASLSTFSGPDFDEAAFKSTLTGDRMATLVLRYWILKLKARFLFGDYTEALAAADKAKERLWTSSVHIWASSIHIQLLDYFYYTALTVAALYENAYADEQSQWRELLRSHREQLREWAENHPSTFGDKHALVSAEMARLEGRELDAERLYEQAIRLARENSFVQNEGLAHELAAWFYQRRGFETIAHAYLGNARHCYLRWGAHGKVRQLDRQYPQFASPEGPGPTATLGSPLQQFDAATVVKASQALSSEIELPKLIERLMTITLENAGADRGLLILPANDDYLIQAEAQAVGDQIEVVLRQEPITGTSCPESLVRYVVRTHESVIIDDASKPNPFAQDVYLRRLQTKAILCLPLIKHGRLTGLLYLENTLTSYAFPPDRVAILELLAAQAAISLENTRLYRDVAEREAKIQRLVDANIIGIFIWDFDGKIVDANDAFLRMVGYDRKDLEAGHQLDGPDAD